MAVLHAAGTPLTTSGYTLLIADDPSAVAAAQRLRHEVFGAELGATLRPGDVGLDVDEFDAYCDHLIVRREGTGEVVGTYRLLPPGRTDRRYAETEFDLAALDPLRDQLVEAGRSCVHPDHRCGAVINLMWAGIIRYLHLRGSRWLGGCASVPVADGGGAAAAVWREVRGRHLAPPPLRVRPHRPWFAEPDAASAPVDGPAGRAALPPLLRGYLRLGAWVCGEPAYDPDFGVADFYVLFSLDRMSPRYLRHFLGTRR
ncbi:ornithine-acyl[acyl carrier protein] N-acyltransferase [Micromonospora citrea]|uniref:Ornithine-acyl[acyl carrier protein] N-acyltransferase n=1 Tax=Micromonospora citrea TaxID=47855 RepID=A0A1C6VIR1_9ACTN|nr:GNAT family N-acyltransferase [Micromonospora citrea]SCL66236.1 ornithine-acyl[acyl carrier protein] N-acyltransferase [Micromonospora citrea]